MSQVPATMQAIIINGNKANVSKIAVPKNRPTYVLCKVDSVALNPTDWKHIKDSRAAPNGISGCDFAGTVVEVGSEVKKSLKPGDRIAGVCHGGNLSNPEDGAFGEYCVAKGDLLVKIPDSLSFEDASTFPLGVSTVGQGLFQKALKLNLPTNPTKHGETVLIYVSIHFTSCSGHHMLISVTGRIQCHRLPRNSVRQVGWVSCHYDMQPAQQRFRQVSRSRRGLRLQRSKLWQEHQQRYQRLPEAHLGHNLPRSFC